MPTPATARRRIISRDASGALDSLTVRIMTLIAQHWSIRRIARLYNLTSAEIFDVARISGFAGVALKTQSNPYWRTPEEWNKPTEPTGSSKSKRKVANKSRQKVRVKRPALIHSEAYKIRKDIMTLLHKKAEAGTGGITSSELSKIYGHAMRRISKQFLNLAVKGEIYKTDKTVRVNDKGVSCVWMLVDKKNEDSDKEDE